MALNSTAYRSEAADLAPPVLYVDGSSTQPSAGSTLSGIASCTHIAVITPEYLHNGIIAEAGGGGSGWALAVKSDGTINAASNSGSITLNGGSYTAGETFFVAAVYEQDGTCSLWKNSTKVDSGSPAAGVSAAGGDDGHYLYDGGGSVSGTISDPFVGVAGYLGSFTSAVSDSNILALAAEKDDISALDAEATSQSIDLGFASGPYRVEVGTTMSSLADATWSAIVTPSSLHNGIVAEAGGSTVGWNLYLKSDGTIEAANNDASITLNGGTYSAGEEFFVAAVYTRGGACSLWKNGTKVDSATAGAVDATGTDEGAFLQARTGVSGSVSSAFSGTSAAAHGFDFALTDTQVGDLWTQANSGGGLVSSNVFDSFGIFRSTVLG